MSADAGDPGLATGFPGVSLPTVSRTLGEWLRQTDLPLQLRDRATGQVLPIDTELAVDPLGLLPVLLVAGEAVWREATGGGFLLALRRDPEAAFGYRIDGIGAGTFSSVMLSTMEAISQVMQPDRIEVSALSASVWQPTMQRLRMAKPVAQSVPLTISSSASPGPA